MAIMTTILESSGVSPPPAAAERVSLPLTFFDMIWLHFIPIRRLLFYDCACSKADFLDTVLPQLKQSLSLTLRHYLPVAGNLLYPLNTDDDDKKPFFRYVPGDSVPLTVTESGGDFEELVGNHARDADQFYDLVPHMPPIAEEDEYKIVPVMALQVTLFPGSGVCIGFSNHHSLGDGSSIARFIWAWAEINKLGGNDDEYLIRKGESLPLFDRSVVNDPLEIDTIFWRVMRKVPLKAPSFPLPTNRVRATYTLHPADIKKLKNLVLAKKPGLRLSSFVVTASYVWTCLLKSGDAIGEEVDEHVAEYFIFTADMRGRMDPPVPASYFGNCLGYGMAKMEHKEVVREGEEGGGFEAAVEAIAEDIRTRVNEKGMALKGAEGWMSEWEKFLGVRALGVSGSPKYDPGSADYGWGRARKLEVVSIDGEKYSMSLCGSKEGGLEVGLSLPKDRMKAFAAIFARGLNF